MVYATNARLMVDDGWERLKARDFRIGRHSSLSVVSCSCSPP
jgi:hypothetical protein